MINRLLIAISVVLIQFQTYCQTSDQFTNLGLLLHSEGMLDEALDAYENAILLDSASFGAFYNRSLVYMDQGSYTKAFDDLNKTIELAPGFAQAFFTLGDAYYETSNPKLALENYYKSLEIDSLFFARNHITGELFSESDTIYEDAGESILMAPPTSFDTRKAGTYWTIAITEFDLELNPKAIESFTEVITSDSSNASAFNYRGICYNMVDEFDTAIEDFDYAISLYNDMCEAYLNRGMSYIYLENTTRGCRDLKIANELCDEPLYERTFEEICAE